MGVDTFQDFVASNGTEASRSYDVIVNKSGITHVQSESEYARTVRSVSRLLAVGGRYAFIMHKDHYAE
jgi:hypothetical protein